MPENVGHRPAGDAKDLEEFIPERLFLGALAGRAGPIAGKLDRIVADFVPRNWHGVNSSKGGGRGASAAKSRSEKGGVGHLG